MGVGPKNRGASRGYIGRNVLATSNFRMYTKFPDSPASRLMTGWQGMGITALYVSFF